MLGFAQQLFQETHNSRPWKNATSQLHRFDWPLLNHMMNQLHLSYVDFALAQRILSVIGSEEQCYAALICHLSMAARQGHLCTTIKDGTIFPSPQMVWQIIDRAGEVSEIDQEIWMTLNKLLIQAAILTNPCLMTEITEINSSVNTPLCIYQNNYYLQRFWLLESSFIKHVTVLLNYQSPRLLVNMDNAQACVQQFLNDNQLLSEQAQAILQACKYPFTIITGGPGTGKTHTAGMLLRVLWEGFSSEQRMCKVVLAAPTGKAAANLEASIQRALRDNKDGFKISSGQTLHSLLRMQKRNIQSSSMVLDADVLLIDECSMIDVHMMERLMESLKPGARLIMLGDRHQLPPVEAGSLFADLVDNLQSSPCLTNLETCLRAEFQGILNVAKKIKEGDNSVIEDFSIYHAHFDSSLKYIALDDLSPKATQHSLLHYAHSLFPYVDDLPKDPIQLLSEYACFRILTPMRRGMLGTEQLNALFFAEVSARAKHACCYTVPIMIVRNHHRLGLFNGEMGLLVKFNDNTHEDFALFASKDSAREVRKVPALLLPAFEYAYCISVHKSQGSEFNHVLMLLPEGSEIFGREALYTGVTRARRLLEVWSTPQVLQQTLDRTSMRHSGFRGHITKTD